MFYFFAFFLFACFCSSAVINKRDDGPPSPGCSTIPDPGLPPIPKTAKPPNTFSNGQDQVTAQYPYSTNPIPDFYQPRDIDIPFGRMHHGNITMFPQGQLEDPKANTAQWTPNQYDFANQSACGIPDNAYSQGKVAIHPYFLKYAGLDRYCLQDVCVSIWSEGDNPDMLVKVTDICSTDPSDPTHCATPNDIKMDRAKVQILYSISGDGKQDAALQSDKYSQGGYWHFSKCWTNALPQPAYQDNWFAQPPLPNNFHWDVDATKMQMTNNQQSYAARGWQLYPNGADIPDATSISQILPINDWVPGEEPMWAPIAGGVGYGTPERSKGKDPPALYPGQSTENAASQGGIGTPAGGQNNTSDTESASTTTSAISTSTALATASSGSSEAPVSNVTLSTTPIIGPSTDDSSTDGGEATSNTDEADGEGDGEGDECEAEL